MRIGRVAAASVLACVAAAQSARLMLEPKRASAQDLAVSGDLAGVPASATQYAAFAALSALPATTLTAKNDLFAQPVQVTGVTLDALAAALGASGAKKQLIAAMCSDGYEGHFTAEYRAAHHPVLALRLNGKAPAQWPQAPDGENLGPYLVAEAAAQPVAHAPGAPQTEQIPYAVTELKFYDEDAVMAALKPRKSTAATLAGYRIAAQNCLRCHRAGGIGGTKSPFEWPQLAMIAQGNPQAFAKYVKEPVRVNPEATMPGNPEYDAATIAAITAYFQAENTP